MAAFVRKLTMALGIPRVWTARASRRTRVRLQLRNTEAALEKLI